eukprot:TRINITY_DN68205_c6_g2_i3.p1 TRINITY_DN68205_c6_g2~~TRINITY_DN68205_c6_g2_i3.p1  ORF type:complete len:585 (+),score=35.44 TRINITY_DN68205_c6_g2_i3:418-2172(+)
MLIDTFLEPLRVLRSFTVSVLKQHSTRSQQPDPALNSTLVLLCQQLTPCKQLLATLDTLSIHIGCEEYDVGLDTLAELQCDNLTSFSLTFRQAGSMTSLAAIKLFCSPLVRNVKKLCFGTQKSNQPFSTAIEALLAGVPDSHFESPLLAIFEPYYRSTSTLSSQLDGCDVTETITTTTTTARQTTTRLTSKKPLLPPTLLDDSHPLTSSTQRSTATNFSCIPEDELCSEASFSFPQSQESRATIQLETVGPDRRHEDDEDIVALCPGLTNLELKLAHVGEDFRLACDNNGSSTAACFRHWFGNPHLFKTLHTLRLNLQHNRITTRHATQLMQQIAQLECLQRLWVSLLDNSLWRTRGRRDAAGPNEQKKIETNFVNTRLRSFSLNLAHNWNSPNGTEQDTDGTATVLQHFTTQILSGFHGLERLSWDVSGFQGAFLVFPNDQLKNVKHLELKLGPNPHCSVVSLPLLNVHSITLHCATVAVLTRWLRFTPKLRVLKVHFCAVKGTIGTSIFKSLVELLNTKRDQLWEISVGMDDGMAVLGELWLKKMLDYPVLRSLTVPKDFRGTPGWPSRPKNNGPGASLHYQ